MRSNDHWQRKVTGKKNIEIIFFLFFLLVPIKAISGSITGTVYQDNGSTPINKAWVMLYDGNCEDRIRIDSVPTGDSSMPGQVDGEYKFDNIPAGSYRIRVESGTLFSNQYAPEWWKSSFDSYACGQAEIITLASGETKSNLNFQLGNGATISGTVFSSDGTTPVTYDNSYIMIYAIDVNDCNNYSSYRILMNETISNGTYSLTLGPGSYYLVAAPYLFMNSNPIEFKTEWWATPRSTPTCSKGKIITISNITDNQTEIDFQLDLLGTEDSEETFSWNLFLPAIIHEN